MSTASKSKSSTAKVRFLMPPLTETRHHNPPANKKASKPSADTKDKPTMPTSPPVSAAQLHDPSGNTRTDFEIAYKISKATDSVAMKKLATVFWRNEIAETSSRLAQNTADMGEIIEAAEEQVEKVKKMENSWRLCLPSSIKDYTETTQQARKQPETVIRESARHFEDMRMEYEKVVVYFKCIDQLKAERSLLLDDQKFMSAHVA